MPDLLTIKRGILSFDPEATIVNPANLQDWIRKDWPKLWPNINCQGANSSVRIS